MLVLRNEYTENCRFYQKYFSMIKSIFHPDFFLGKAYVSTVVENHFEYNTISLKYRKLSDKKKSKDEDGLQHSVRNSSPKLFGN